MTDTIKLKRLEGVITKHGLNEDTSACNYCVHGSAFGGHKATCPLKYAYKEVVTATTSSLKVFHEELYQITPCKFKYNSKT